MINRVILVGRLTKDVELRRTPSNAAVCNFTVAVDNPFTKDASGNSSASFINCVAWNRSAEILEKYCKKGSQIGVEGRLQSRSYERRDGTKAQVVEVICDSITLLGSKSTSNNNSSSSPFEDSFVNDQDSDQDLDMSSMELADDDLPF